MGRALILLLCMNHTYIFYIYYIMSSWANRRVLRKRIEPHIYNELILATKQQNLPLTQPSIQRNQQSEQSAIVSKYVTEKVQTLPSPTAVELTHNDMTFVFVILRHLRNNSDNELWIHSYNCIRKYYTNKIIIIDDNSHIKSPDDAYVFDTDIIYSEFKGAGEILPYYYFLKYKWADKMIFLHDSMFLNRPFRESELESDIKFHWHFPKEYIRDNKKLWLYASLLTNNTELKDFIQNTKSEWLGCFGVACIIEYNIIQILETKYNLFSTLVISIKARKDRELFERLFGVILYSEGLTNIGSCSNFGNILQYPMAFESINSTIDNLYNVINQKGYNTAIIKVWRGR